MQNLVYYFSVKSACSFFFSFLTLSHTLTHGPMINRYIQGGQLSPDVAVSEDTVRKGGSLKLTDIDWNR